MENLKKKENLDLLQEAIAEGIIDIDIEGVQKILDMKKKEHYLSMHTYKIWEDKNGKWFTYLPDETKTEKRRKVKKSTKEDLENAIVKYYKALENEEEQSKTTLRAIFPLWLEYKAAHTDASNSIYRYQSDWRRFYLTSPQIIDKPIAKLTVLELDLWIHNLIKEYSMTKTCYYNMSMIIRQCFDYAVDTLRLIPENTFRKVKIQTKLLKKYVKKDDSTQVFLTDETSLIFKSAMADLEKNPNNTAPLAVMLTFFTGLRRGEIVSLRYSDTTFNTLQICHMERDIYDYSDIENVSYVGKKVIDGAKTDAGVRPVPLIPYAVQIINTVKAINEKNGWYDDGFLFLDEEGTRMKSHQVKYRIEKYCDENGIPRKSFHKIRKTYISTLLDAHVNLNEIRKACGHVDERTTLNNYCYNRKNKADTYQQFNTALIQDNGLSNLPDILFAV